MTTIKTRPPDVCRLTLHIRGVAYSVRPVASEDGRAWRLRNRDNGHVYDVADTLYGPTCDCGDQVFRHEGRDAIGCKHIRSLRAVGLFPEINPREYS